MLKYAGFCTLREREQYINKQKSRRDAGDSRNEIGFGTIGGWSGREDSNLRPYGSELITNIARLCFSMVYGHAGIWLFMVF